MSKKQSDISYNNKKDTWENTAKEQPYLMPGTEAYEERQEDLMEHNPFRPDDKWHEQEEKEAREIPHGMRKRALQQQKVPGGRFNYQTRIRKDVQFGDVKKTAIEEAAKTPSPLDDIAARNMDRDDVEDLVLNNGVSEDEYLPKAIRRFIE